MTYQELRVLKAKQEDTSGMVKIGDYFQTVHFEVKQECNNHGDDHMNNVYWSILDENNKEIKTIWFTQICGPFYQGNIIIDSKIIFLDGKVVTLGSITSDELKDLLQNKSFRLEKRNASCRLRNRYTLLNLKSKRELCESLKSMTPEERMKFPDYGGECMEFFEVEVTYTVMT